MATETRTVTTTTTTTITAGCGCNSGVIRQSSEITLSSFDAPVRKRTTSNDGMGEMDRGLLVTSNLVLPNDFDVKKDCMTECYECFCTIKDENGLVLLAKARMKVGLKVGNNVAVSRQFDTPLSGELIVAFIEAVIVQELNRNGTNADAKLYDNLAPVPHDENWEACPGE